MQRYSLTLCAFEREPRFTTHEVVEPARSQLLQRARDFRFELTAYCFMPDHLHVLAVGESEDSDLGRFISRMKQDTGYWYSKTCRKRLWQEGFYDRILRNDEETIVVARYILDNPVRAGLVARFDEYPFSGSSRYSIPELADAIQSQG
jgi:putative transposase